MMIIDSKINCVSNYLILEKVELLQDFGAKLSNYLVICTLNIELLQEELHE